MVTRKDRKRYSKEFKTQAIKRCEESGKPVTEIARELDISVQRLYRWRDNYYKDPTNAFMGSGHKSSPITENKKTMEDMKRVWQDVGIIIGKTIMPYVEPSRIM